MIEHAQNINHAIVTMDVALPGIVWGWMITLNMWAKSIATGVILVGAYLLARYGKDDKDLKGLKNVIPIIAFVFLHIFLLFTLLDLHQPFRMVNIFFHPHWTSAITVGAWLATALTGAVVFLVYLVMFKNETGELYDKVMKVATVLAIPVTLYTAVIMGQSSARELWQTPAELVQMSLAAFLVGAATLSFFSDRWSANAKRDLGIIMAASAFLMFTVYMGEYFLSWKLAEAEATMAYVHSGGEYNFMFWLGQISIFAAFALAFMSTRNSSSSMLKLAAIISIVGLYIAKHVWLIIPQLLPLS